MAFGKKKGDRLGEWVIERRLGEGGNSEGYVVRKGTDTRFAKVFSSVTAGDRLLRPERVRDHEIFQAELQRRSLSFTGFGATVFEEFVCESHFVKIMTLLTGTELTKELDGALRVPPEKSLVKRLRIATAFLDAMQSCHKLGVANLDLKPDNAFVFELPSGHIGIRLIDFDNGWIQFNDPRTNRPYRRLGYGGTPGYLAPEHLWYQRQVEDRAKALRAKRPAREVKLFPELPADVFQAGLVLFEILTRQSMVGLLRGEEPALVLATATKAGRGQTALKDLASGATGLASAEVRVYSALVGRMLALAPNRRPTMAAAHAELKKLCEQSIKDREPKPPPPVQPKPPVPPRPVPPRPPVPPPPPPGVRLVMNGRETGRLEMREGAAVNLDAAVFGLAALKFAIGSLRWSNGRIELRANVQGIQVNGKDAAAGLTPTVVQRGSQITYQGAKIVLT